MVDIVIPLDTGQGFTHRILGVYAPWDVHDTTETTTFWSKVTKLCLNTPSSWTLLGDLNATVIQAERKTGGTDARIHFNNFGPFCFVFCPPRHRRCCRAALSVVVPSLSLFPLPRLGCFVGGLSAPRKGGGMGRLGACVSSSTRRLCPRCRPPCVVPVPVPSRPPCPSPSSLPPPQSSFLPLLFVAPPCHFPVVVPPLVAGPSPPFVVAPCYHPASSSSRQGFEVLLVVVVLLMGMWSCHHPAAPQAGAHGSGGGGSGGTSRCRQ